MSHKGIFTMLYSQRHAMQCKKTQMLVNRLVGHYSMTKKDEVKMNAMAKA